MTEALVLLVFPALVAYSAVSDLLRMTISNRVTGALTLAFVVVALASGMPLADMAWHGAAGAVVLVVAFACFALGWIGGGDAKMAAATALWLGAERTLDYLFIGSLFGGALTLALLAWRSWPLPAFAGRQSWIARLHHPKTGIPYGIALAAAALMIYPETAWMTAVIR